MIGLLSFPLILCLLYCRANIDKENIYFKSREHFSRTGHSKLLAQYRYLIDKADSPLCECGNDDEEQEEQTIDHLLCKCHLLNSSREQLKIHNISPDWMVTEPDLCRRLLSTRFPELKLGTGTEEDTSNPEM